jgi:hypothetical protein
MKEHVHELLEMIHKQMVRNKLVVISILSVIDSYVGTSLRCLLSALFAVSMHRTALGAGVKRPNPPV